MNQELRTRITNLLSTLMILRLRPEDFKNLRVKNYRGTLWVSHVSHGTPTAYIGPKTANRIGFQLPEVMKELLEMGVKLDNRPQPRSSRYNPLYD